MSVRQAKNLSASVRAKLLNRSRERREDFQFVLGRWVAERFLYRLGQSAHRDRYVLKGATLFLVWQGGIARPTRDLDFLAYGSSEASAVTKAIREICQVPADDGLVFELGEIRTEETRAEAEYDGMRVLVPAALDQARVVLQLDLGFGDAVEPPSSEIELPVMLEFPAPKVRAYPAEVVIAEKFQAMVQLGIANSRMKDFFDLWALSREQAFQMTRLRRAVRATFERRRTPLPKVRPTALTDDFLKDQAKAALWKAFLKRVGSPEGAALGEVGEAIARFIMPVVERSGDDGAERRWPPNGPWTAG